MVVYPLDPLHLNLFLRPASVDGDSGSSGDSPCCVASVRASAGFASAPRASCFHDGARRRRHRRHQRPARAARQLARRSLHCRTFRHQARPLRSRCGCGRSRYRRPLATAIAASVTTPIAASVTAPIPIRTLAAARLRLRIIRPPAPFQNFALIQPALDPDHAIRGVRFGKSVIDIGAQRMQRQLPLQIPLRARDLRAIQPARHAHLDAPAAETQRRIHRFAHGAAESHALFELQRNRLRHQLRVELRLMHFLDVDKHFALGALGQIRLQLLDLGAFAADDDARAAKSGWSPAACCPAGRLQSNSRPPTSAGRARFPSAPRSSRSSFA